MTRDMAIYILDGAQRNSKRNLIRNCHPITREQVEKMLGEWKIYLNGNYNDEIYYCDVCGCDLDALARSNSFCSVCGSPMTDNAVDILWKRLEAMQNAD